MHPTALHYRGTTNPRESGKSVVIAMGMREGWSDIFLADQRANELSTSELTEIFKNVTGKGEAVSRKMATTFRAFADQADWDASPPSPEVTTTDQDDQDDEELSQVDAPARAARGVSLHQDVHIHLPPSTDVATYTAIFRALREELLD